MSEESYTLDEMTALAREKAKGARNVDLRKVRCVLLPCRICWSPSTHVHTLPRFRGTIMLEPTELFLPKHLQEWLVGHEVSHLHTKRGHRAHHFDDVESRLIGSDHDQLWREYWGYRRTHQSELRSLVRSFVAARRRAPELTTQQKLDKLLVRQKLLKTKLKRTTTALHKVELKIRRLEKKAEAVER